MRRRDLLIVACILFVAGALSGCGGGGTGDTAASGELAVGVRFPQDGGAKIPPNAESVRIQVLAPSCTQCPASGATPGQPLVPDTILNKPSGGGLVEATIRGIPVGDVIVRALAHPQQNGVGPALANAQTPARIRAGATAEVTLTLAAIVDRVVATPPDLLLLVGERDQVIARALDAVGEVLLDASLRLSSDDRNVATIDANGKVEAKGLGETTLRARHVPSGREATVAVKVVPARIVRVDVSPERGASAIDHPVAFGAVAYDDVGQPFPGAVFDWRVEDAAFGEIDGAGCFMPKRLGNPRVIATEQTSGVEGVGQVLITDWVVVLKWAAGGDADLHLFDVTQTNHAYFGQLDVPIGKLLGDDTTAPGQETFAGNRSVPGRYPVAVNFFGSDAPESGRTTELSGEVTLLPGEAPSYTTTFTLCAPNSNGDYPVTAPTDSWARPFDVLVTASETIVAVPADTSIALGPPGSRSK